MMERNSTIATTTARAATIRAIRVQFMRRLKSEKAGDRLNPIGGI
jgi:hypothetical protein